MVLKLLQTKNPACLKFLTSCRIQLKLQIKRHIKMCELLLGSAYMQKADFLIVAHTSKIGDIVWKTKLRK